MLLFVMIESLHSILPARFNHDHFSLYVLLFSGTIKKTPLLVTTMTFKKILKKQRKEIYQIAELYGARNIRVFGSVKKESDNPDSDVDFLVDLEKDRSLLDLAGFVYDLQQLLNRKVDVVTENGLHWYIKKAILNEAEPL
jgi:predicted nucleotidyltransferase